MRPLVGSISRLIIFMVVVLPQPDGPTSTHSSPSGTSRVSSSTATWPSKRLVTRSSRITRPDASVGPVVLAANGPNSWIWWRWVETHGDTIYSATREHVVLTGLAVGIGLLISLPLGVLAWRWRWLGTPILAVTGVLYTIPSLALFALLIPVTGLSRTTAEIG